MATPDPFRAALFLVAAFVIAGFAHTAWLRSRTSRRFLWPVDGGLTFRGRRLLGVNKTVRGFMMMVPAAGAAFGLLSLALGGSDGAALHGLWALTPLQYALLGAWCGLGFMVAELPNSFVKRQLGIPEGGAPPGRAASAVHFLADRLDSIIGLLAAVSVAVPTPLATWGWMLLLGPAIHWGFSALLYRVGVKARAA